MKIKKSFLLYGLLVALISLIFGYTINDSYVDKYIKYKINYTNSEIGIYYNTLLSIHERQDAQVGSGATIMIGDSITQGLLYPRFVNYGIGSDTTYGVLNRLSKYSSLKESEKIILMIGVNDLKRRSNDEIISNYQRILDILPNEKLVVFSILPVNKPLEEKNPQIKNMRIKVLNERLSNLCKRNAVNFIEIYDDFVDENGYLDKSYHVGDGIHLNAAGYKVWVNYLNKL